MTCARSRPRGRPSSIPNLFTLNNTVNSNLQSQNYTSLVRVAGYFAQAGIDLWDQLYLTAAVRADQSSTFPKADRTNWYPKASVAWNAFGSGSRGAIGPVSYLKLRAAYGAVGREPIPYQILDAFSGGAQGLDYGGGTTSPTQNGLGGLVSDTVKGAPTLKPERTGEFEGGFDFGLFKQRIDGGITLYNAKTTDVIFYLPVPVSTGYKNVTSNGGEITNKGAGGVAQRACPRVQHAPLGNRRQLGEEQEQARRAPGRRLRRAHRRLREQRRRQRPAVRHVLRHRLGALPLRASPTPTTSSRRASAKARDINALCRAANAPNGSLFVDANGFPIHGPGQPRARRPESGLDLGHSERRSRSSRSSRSRRSSTSRRAARTGTERASRCSASGPTATPQLARRATRDLVCTGNEQEFGVTIEKSPGVVGPGAGKSVPVGENWWRAGLGNNFNGPTGQGVEDAGYVKLREVSAAYTWESARVRSLTGFTAIEFRLAGAQPVHVDGLQRRRSRDEPRGLVRHWARAGLLQQPADPLADLLHQSHPLARRRTRYAYANSRRARRDHGCRPRRRRLFRQLLRRTSSQREPEQAVERAAADQQFVGFQAFTFYGLTGDVNRLASLWMQQMAGTGRQWAGYDQYVVTENDFTMGSFLRPGRLSSTFVAFSPRCRTTSSISGSPRRGKR